MAARSVQNAPATLALHVDGVTFEFARIPPGRFTMGSPHRYVDEYNWTYEMPAREVTIDYPYYIGVTEVTVEQFRLFVEQTGYVTDAEKHGWAFVTGERDWHFELLLDWRHPGYLQTDREPVVCLGWYDAVAFCRWVSVKTGYSIRLPSEAEWEYACRAGTTGDHAGSLGEMGWYAWNSAGRTHPVAQKKPNAWGLYDMQGNAWEWVQDLYHRDGSECADRRFGLARDAGGGPAGHHARRLVLQSRVAMSLLYPHADAVGAQGPLQQRSSSGVRRVGTSKLNLEDGTQRDQPWRCRWGIRTSV